MSKKADTSLSEPLLAPQKCTVIREILSFSSFGFLLFILRACTQKIYIGCLSSLKFLYISVEQCDLFIGIA